MSTIISLTDERDEALEKATETLKNGSVVVLPVGGVYAIVADAFRTAATQRVFAARRRSRVTPLPVLVRTERQLGGLAKDVPDYADRLIAAYWPGDVTLILEASVDLTWDLGNSLGTVQVRLPEDEFLRDLIGNVGPLACTAANRLSQPRPTTVEDAKAQLGVLVPVYLDGGETDGSVSTVVDCTGTAPVIARPGSVPDSHITVVAAGEVEWGERPDPALFPPDEPEPDEDEVSEDEVSEDPKEQLEEALADIEDVVDELEGAAAADADPSGEE